MDEKKRIKRTVGQKILNAVFRGDDYKTFALGLWEGQVLPLIGDILEDQLGNIIHAVFYDDDYYDSRSSRKRKNGRSRRRHTDFSDISTRKRKERRSGRRSMDVEDDEVPSDLNARETHLVPFKDRSEAEDCLFYLKTKIREEGKASAYDFFHFAGVASTNFTNKDWGWVDERDISRAIPRKKDGKYFLELPEPENLDDYDEEEEYDD